MIERQSKLHAAATRLWERQGRAPSSQDLSAALGWTPQEVEELLIAVQPTVQLQQPITDEGTALQDVLEDTQTPQPEVLIAEEQVRRGVHACLGHLPEREALILRLRYGLEACEPQSLQEMGTCSALAGSASGSWSSRPSPSSASSRRVRPWRRKRWARPARRGGQVPCGGANAGVVALTTAGAPRRPPRLGDRGWGTRSACAPTQAPPGLVGGACATHEERRSLCDRSSTRPRSRGPRSTRHA